MSTIIPYPIPNPPKILVYIKGPEFQIIETGSTVRYNCGANSVDNVSKWKQVI